MTMQSHSHSALECQTRGMDVVIHWVPCFCYIETFILVAMSPLDPDFEPEIINSEIQE